MSKITITTRLANATPIRLQLSTSSGFASIAAESPLLTPHATYFTVRHQFSGLAPDTKYFVRVTSNRTPIGSLGSFWSAPAAGAQSFAFAGGSCQYTGNNSPVYDAIKARIDSGEAKLFLHMGDMHYQDPLAADVGAFHTAVNLAFAAPKQNALWSNVAMAYMHDDHDSGINDGSSTNNNRAQSIEYARTTWPNSSFANASPTACPYYSFVRGRLRFVVTDTRLDRQARGTFPSADPQQTVFSAAQKQWFFDELTAAKNAGQGIVWVNTYPWISAASDGGDNWGGYAAARTEVANFITTNALSQRMFITSGDAHMLAYDDGTSANNPGALRVCHAAGLGQTGSIKGGPYLRGGFANPNANTGQYGLWNVTDGGGSSIGVRFRGIRVADNAPTESVLIDETFSLTV